MCLISESKTDELVKSRFYFPLANRSAGLFNGWFMSQNIHVVQPTVKSPGQYDHIQNIQIHLPETED